MPSRSSSVSPFQEIPRLASYRGLVYAACIACVLYWFFFSFWIMPSICHYRGLCKGHPHFLESGDWDLFPKKIGKGTSVNSKGRKSSSFHPPLWLCAVPTGCWETYLANINERFLNICRVKNANYFFVSADIFCFVISSLFFF